MKRIPFFIILLIIVISCDRDKAVSLEPYGYETFNQLTIKEGDLKAVFVDNSEIPPDHKAGYNGITRLYHTLQDSSVFVPAIAGLNLEHIFSGDSLEQFYEPRINPMTLYKKSDTRVMLYQKTTPVSGVESLTDFELVAPHYIDITFRFFFQDINYFRHGYAGFFWASYINAPPDRNIYFRGISSNGTGEEWISAFSDRHGKESTHLGTGDNYQAFFAPDFRIVLANNFSRYHYSMPFYYGRFHNMVIAFLFDSSEIIRFTQSPTGGGKFNPAWDFQYLIPSPKAKKEYNFNVRVVYKPFISNEDIMQEYEKWKNRKLSKVGENRSIYPVVWAHHDDHRYFGRPYLPLSNFNSLLDRINSKGYGIIHWTTHPLDLFFSNYENQVWKNSENETIDQTISKFATSLLRRDDSSLHQYFSQWFNEAPMFGRETSDDFLPLNTEYELDGYESSEEVIKKAEQRLAILNRVDVKALNKIGEREYRYQMGIEKFIISLFTCHQYGHAAYIALQQGNQEEAVALVKKIHPVETVQLFAGTIREYGATRGEEGLLISLNLRWLPDYIDLKQRVGLEPVRINFQPTSHDPLAQGMGTNTFFVDEAGDFWLSLGEKEVDILAEASDNLPMKKVTESWLVVDGNDSIPIKTMRGFDLPAAEYSIRLIFAEKRTNCKVEIIEPGKPVSVFSVSSTEEKVSARFKTGGDGLKIRLIPEEGVVKLAGLILE